MNPMRMVNLQKAMFARLNLELSAQIQKEAEIKRLKEKQTHKGGK